MADKYQDTKKAKAQADKMSAEIAKKLGYDSPKTKTAPAPKASKKPAITPRKRLDVSKMTPAQKQAYYNQPGYENY